MKNILYALGGIAILVLATLVVRTTNNITPNLGAGVYTGERTVMDEVATTTIGTEFLTNDYKLVLFTVANTASTGTHRFACSDQEDVDFATAAGPTNRWDYTEVVDRENGSSIDGDTGWATTNNSEVRSFVVNIDGSYYCTAFWTRTNGTSTVMMRPYNNQ